MLENRRNKYLFPTCWLICILLGTSPAYVEAQQRIRIAVAANLMLPMQEVKEAFEQKHSASSVELIGGSTGKLTTQIKNVAPFHIFLSADYRHTQLLYQEGFLCAPPQTLVHGQLVLWLKEPLKVEQLPSFLQSMQVRSIAVGQPELAPYGQHALHWLKMQGIEKTVARKLIFGESVGKVNQYIYTQSVDAAFTAVSSMHTTALQSVGHWYLLPQQEVGTLPHSLALLNIGSEAERKLARSFVDFLFTDNAKVIFQKFGYEPPQTHTE